MFENQKMCSILEKRENKLLKPVHLAAYLLEPNQRGDNLTDAENLIATEFIYETARRHPKYSSQVDLIMEALAQYKIRGTIFAKEFAISSEISMSGPVCWTGICSSSKISRFAVDILNLPSSTAAIERTFSTYGFIHRQRRNRLTVERAGKLTYIAHNYNLLNEEDHLRIVEVTKEEIEKEDIGFEVIDSTQLMKEKEESDDEVGDDDEDDLPLSTLLRSPF
ncbi:ribonuclease h-like superfamily [Holotrichia oblita]|uniref:Ribonuclease h-like superfamily n=1 Tax=Holotrichia oblita TaxID=644536 RepID=A0ACB9SUW0_HOLOL|nr:ribonuclease h-like superfamily [Holotrichia oblita]